ncbi:SigE family RNA polymerase sigma factor [Actinoplanes sp. URMC 104]|uniref:SigE family RNA polymerase sigma factor n=1 Tax=Actinoplanes sp. URMC 104 TaxID=3423409 RepID=UPI003F1C42C1
MRRDSGSGRTERDEQFHDFVVGRRPHLLHTATLLTAGDTHLAEDLVQAALTKLYVAWPSFQRADNPDGYVRRVLVNTLIDEKRRIWRRREQTMAVLPEVEGSASPSSGPVGEAVQQALRELPPRMRAAVVFRYFYDLDVAATADALSCSEGNVKSQTARGLDRLRAALHSAHPTFMSQGATR